MRRLSTAIGRPVSFALLQVDDDPELWRKQLDASLDGLRRGRRAVPAGGRATDGPVDGALRHATACSPRSLRTGSCRQRHLPPDELAAALADPEVRRSIISWTPSSPAQAEAMDKAYHRTFVLGDPPDYEPGPERSLAGLAAAQDVSPLEVAYDEMARAAGRGCSTCRS